MYTYYDCRVNKKIPKNDLLTLTACFRPDLIHENYELLATYKLKSTVRSLAIALLR